MKSIYLETLSTEDTTESALERLVIVSNREPYTINYHEKEIRLEKTPGGLVSALDPVLRQRNGLWICWEGAPKKVPEFDDVSVMDEHIDWEKIELPYQIHSVALTEKEINHYYYGYANTRLWPLFHYFVSRCNFFDERDWPSYYSANQKFANAVIEQTSDNDWIFVQDYHLLLVPQMVRAQQHHRKIGFFLHIPFPSVEVFKALPRRDIILRGMLGSDLIAFHVEEYVRHFLDTVERLLPASEVSVNHADKTIRFQGRMIQVRAFPIGIDYEQIEQLALSPEIQEEARRLNESYHVEHIAISVDRLDYTKGILENMEAIRLFFDKFPEYKKRLCFIQIAAPARTEVPEYRKMKEEIDQAVGRINGELSQENWIPIHYFYRSFPLDEVLPYFMISDVAMVTPLRDGLNLVAKEYCVAKVDLNGVLLLSEFTGSASEMKEALPINPFYVEHVADTLYRALQMPVAERHLKMHSLRETVRKNDSRYWIDSFMKAFQHAITHRQHLEF